MVVIFLHIQLHIVVSVMNFSTNCAVVTRSQLIRHMKEIWDFGLQACSRHKHTLLDAYACSL